MTQYRVSIVGNGSAGCTSYADKQSARENFKAAVASAMFNPKVSDVLLIDNDTGRVLHHWQGGKPCNAPG